MGRIRVGVSGWNYGGWRGDFYPDSLPRSDELAYVGSRFDTVEVNGTAVHRGDHRRFRVPAPARPGRSVCSPYGEEALRRWAARIRAWREADEPDDAARITDREPPAREGRDVYVYFDNDEGGHAPREARRLRELVDDDPG